MRTPLFLLVGFLLLAACMLLGRLFSNNYPGATSPLGGSGGPSRGSRVASVIERLVVAVERVVEINFGVHVPLDQVASLVTGFGACGLVRALDDTQRNYAVTVRRAGAMEYLE